MQISKHKLSRGCVLAIALLLGPLAKASEAPDAILTASASSLAASAKTPDQMPAAAFNAANNAVQNTLIPTIWPNAPEWLKRTEWDAQLTSVNGPEFNLLTTQPLWQSNDLKHTFFAQGSFERYNLYDIARNTVNVGGGYRHLFFDNSLLIGANNFYDYEFEHNHARSSVGLDVKWNVVDAYSNFYYRLSGARSVNGAMERVNNGYDFGLGAPLPYLPWAKVYGRYYNWEGIVANDVDGGEFSTELAIHPNFTLVAGLRGEEPDTTRHGKYIMLQFHLGSDGNATLLTKPVAERPFEARDLQQETLAKVRRENRIMIERVAPASGGITVVIKKG